MDLHLLDQINTLSVFLFVLFAILVISKIALRYFRYRRAGLKIPKLLPRDFFLFTGLVVPFAGILLFRAFGIVVKAEWWYPIWVLASDFLGVAGIVNWAYYEYFIIEK